MKNRTVAEQGVFGFLNRWGVPVIALYALGLFGCAEKQEKNYQGYVEGEFVYVASPEAGRLDQLLVARGDSVKADSTLFVLESELETAAQRQAKRRLDVAEAQLRDLLVGKRPQELAVVREQLAQACAEAKRVSSSLVRDESQFQAGGISKAQVEASRAAAESISARVRELDHQIDVAGLPARTEQIRAQEATVEAARAALDQSDWSLNQKTVAAQVAGRVFDTMYRLGEWVPAGRPVVRMLPPENLKIRFFVPESIVGGLAIGQKISFRCDGVSSNFAATVSYVSPESEYTPPIIYSNDTRSKLVFMVEARTSAEDAIRLHPGQPVEVYLK